MDKLLEILEKHKETMSDVAYKELIEQMGVIKKEDEKTNREKVSVKLQFNCLYSTSVQDEDDLDSKAFDIEQKINFFVNLPVYASKGRYLGEEIPVSELFIDNKSSFSINSYQEKMASVWISMNKEKPEKQYVSMNDFATIITKIL